MLTTLEPTQVERFTVERFKRVVLGRWAWVIVGTFNASTAEEARKKARTKLENPICFLRANLIGTGEILRR